MLTILLCLLIIYIVSRLQVLDNSTAIKLDAFDTEGKPVATKNMHTTWNVVRLIVLVAMGIVLLVRGQFPWWVVSISMILLNFGYSYVLRTELNKAMKWPKNYLGGTAYYDAFWIAITSGRNIWRVIRQHQARWNAVDLEYSRDVIDAGRWASRFELACTTIGVSILVIAHYV